MFDDARASMAAVLDGELHAGVLLAGEGVEELAGFAAALRGRCVEVAMARPVVWCAEGAAEEVSRAAAALATGAGGAVALADDFPVESYCPEWGRLREALDAPRVRFLRGLLAPVRPTAYVVGAGDELSARRVAAALCRLDARRALVMHPDGVVELCDGAVGDLRLPEADDASVR